MHSILLSELLLSACPIEAAFTLIAANDTRRCPTCYTWYIDLDSPKSTPSQLQSLHLHKHCSRSLAREICPQCHQEETHLALAKNHKPLTAHHHLHQREQRPESFTATPYPKISRPPELRRYVARRDVKLYQALRDRGSKLPALPARCAHDQGIDSLLNQKQERALFHALQELGAFRYPGMAENMRDREGRALPDEKIFEVIRQSDCRWNMERGWVQEGERVCFEKPPPPFSECVRRGAKGLRVRWWDKRVLVSGRILPRRMKRADFRLQPIVEVDEVWGADGRGGFGGMAVDGLKSSGV